MELDRVINFRPTAEEAPDDKAPSNQAERIVAKMGGAYTLAKLMNLHPTTIYKWTYSEEHNGTGGIIPGRQLRKLLKVAREEGIFITANDLFPGR